MLNGSSKYIVQEIQANKKFRMPMQNKVEEKNDIFKAWLTSW